MNLNFKTYLPITWSSLYVGLKNDWITAKETSQLINENLNNLNCKEDIQLEINVHDDDKQEVLKIIKKQLHEDDSEGILMWQLAHLKAIEQSNLSITEKLKNIEIQWSRFGYPEKWREFIYYMPNTNNSTEESIYQKFLVFLSSEKI